MESQGKEGPGAASTKTPPFLVKANNSSTGNSKAKQKQTSRARVNRACDEVNEIKLWTPLLKTSSPGVGNASSGGTPASVGHSYAFGNTEEKARRLNMGCKARGQPGQPFDHKSPRHGEDGTLSPVWSPHSAPTCTVHHLSLGPESLVDPPSPCALGRWAGLHGRGGSTFIKCARGSRRARPQNTSGRAPSGSACLAPHTRAPLVLQ